MQRPASEPPPWDATPAPTPVQPAGGPADNDGMRCLRLVLPVALLALGFTAHARADVFFETPAFMHFASGAPTVAFRAGLSIGDLDHDGFPEVVAPSQVGTLVLRGRGDGTLEMPVLAHGDARHTGIGDFDGDGHADIAWGTGASFGNGTGALWDSLLLAPSNGGLAVADFDGDGRDDIAAYEYPGAITTWLGRSDRTFQAVPGTDLLPPSSGFKFVRVCDLDLDGRLDLVIDLDYAQNVDFVALLGRGDGTFALAPQTVSGGNNQGLAVADFTSDGYPDVVISYGWFLNLYRGIGDGTFAPPELISFDGQGEYDLAAGDVTGDGIPDLVTAMTYQAGLAVRAGHGDGTFDPYALSPLHLSLLGLELADLNGDGHLDAVSMCEEMPGVVVGLGDGQGGFGTPTQAIPTPLASLDVAIADLDGDGHADIVSSGGYSAEARLMVMRGLGGRSFEPAAVVPLLDPGGRRPEQLLLTDLNRDGIPDAVAQFGWSAQTALGDGQGGFLAPWSVAFAALSVELRAGDATGDSIPDLIGSGSAGIRIWPGVGDGTVSTAIDVACPSPLQSLDVGDLNHDGILDLAISTAAGVAFALGDGAGGFNWSTEVWQAPAFSTVTVSIGDLNGDGRDDVVASGAVSPWCSGTLLCSRIATRFQTPDGGLTPWTEQPWVASTCRGITDLNGDGRGELMLYASGIGVARADSSGVMVLEPGYGIGGPYDRRAFAVGDLDDDGRPDLAVTFGAVQVFYGTGPVPPALPVPGPPVAGAPGPRILSAWPNPAHGRLQVRFAAPAGEAVDLALFDPAGRRRVTLQRDAAPAAGETTVTASTTGLAPGIYFMRLTTSSGTHSRRIVLLD